jgi:hypothetical protein
MFNVNGPPRGSNVSSDQSSYDMLCRDVIFNSNVATLNNNVYSFNLQTDNIDRIYKTELVTATIDFSGNIPPNVRNQCVFLNIPQLNGNTTRMASNVLAGNSSQGNLSTQGSIFCQVPDNNTPLLIGNNPSNGIISLFIANRQFECVQFYNPPISNLNRIDISLADPLSNTILSSGIKSFYFTIKIYYFQKRNTTTAFSVPVVNYMSGTTDSAFVPFNS